MVSLPYNTQLYTVNINNLELHGSIINESQRHNYEFFKKQGNKAIYI